MTGRFRSLWARLQSHPRYGAWLQFIQFGIVGASNTLIALGVYQLCLHAFHMHYQLANLLSFVVSVTNAYYWNSRYVFKSDEAKNFRRHAAAYLKTLLSYGSTFLLSTALLTLWVEVFHMSKAIAPIINLVITIPLNFMLNKFWTFRSK